VVVYHGTILRHALDIINNGVDLTHSKEFLDFGKGFYTTNSITMAENMAHRVEANERKRKGVKNVFPAILTFEYVENSELNYKRFEYDDIEWAKFIMANRVTPQIADKLGLLDNSVDFKYDVVIGGTADGDVAKIASKLRYEILKPQDYILNLSDFLRTDGTSYGTQIVFCTEEGLSCIKYSKCDII
jgi:hypothetical protein